MCSSVARRPWRVATNSVIVLFVAIEKDLRALRAGLLGPPACEGYQRTLLLQGLRGSEANGAEQRGGDE